jgi:hypothetical protein
MAGTAAWRPDGKREPAGALFHGSDTIIRGITNAMNKVMPASDGLTERNESLPRQLDDPARLLSLLRLPADIVAEAEKAPPNPGTARADADRGDDRNPDQGADPDEEPDGAAARAASPYRRRMGRWSWSYPGGRSKNRQAFEVQLRRSMVRLLHRFLTVDRALFAQPGSP